MTLFCIAAALFGARGIPASSLQKKAVQCWCFIGTALGAMQHCFVLPWSFFGVCDINPLSLRFFCGHKTLVICHRGLLGRATLFCVALAFFGARDIDPSSSRLFCCCETLGFLRGLLGPRDIVCAATVLFLGARH